MKFKNRRTAGRKLGAELSAYAQQENTVVLGLARGGLPVAEEVARQLDAPLDAILVQKLGLPGHEELAIGAIASGNVRILNQDLISNMNIQTEMIDQIAEREQEELVRRAQTYRGGRDRIDLHQKTVILVDDGLATGASMRAAVKAVKTQQPDQIIVAVPVAAPDICRKIESEVSEVICLQTPDYFGGVGAWFESFDQVSDQEVQQILQASKP